MAVPLTVRLSDDQVAELTRLRDQHPKPYVRERAAAILKVAAGWSVRSVAQQGLLQPRRPETVRDWIHRFLTTGRDGLVVSDGRGRKSSSSRGASCGRGGDTGSKGGPWLTPVLRTSLHPAVAGEAGADRLIVPGASDIGLLLCPSGYVHLNIILFIEI